MGFRKNVLKREQEESDGSTVYRVVRELRKKYSVLLGDTGKGYRRGDM